jgi:uncharacterized membrane protein YfcA
LLAIAIPAGLLIGLSLGALGGGGSILTVPVLVYLLHQPPHAATAGSLLIVGITATGGMIAHWRAGRVRLGPGIASRLTAAFTVLLIAVAAYSLARSLPGLV